MAPGCAPAATTRWPACVEDALRATGLGVKCLLVADEGVLWTLHRLREQGVLPADTTFKVSALIGPVNPASFAVFEQLGADSINIPSDLTLAQFTEIRRVSRAPMDLYIEAPDDLGGYVRMYEVAELIRRGAPLYLKFGLAKSPGIYPYGQHLRELALSTAKERVRRGRPRAGPARAARGGRRDGPAGQPTAGPAQPVRDLVITFRKHSPQKKTQPRTIPHTRSRSFHSQRSGTTGPSSDPTSRMMTMRNRRAALAAVASAASLALALTACGQNSEGGGEEKKGGADGATIGVAMPTKSSERWISDGANVVKELKSKGYKTKLVYGEDDPDQQVSQIENMITQGVDALVVAAIDNKSLNNVLQQAKDADIPVISYDRLILGTENVDYYASFDNEKVGELQGSYIVDKLGLEDGKKGPFSIELFAYSNDDNNTKYFFQGAMNVLKPHIDKGELVVRSKQTALNQVTTLRWDGGTAQKRMDDLLTSSYRSAKVDAVLSPYDGISIGILSALKSDGYGTKAKPMPVVTGQDAELASVKSIIAGDQTQTVYKDLRKLAKVASNMVDAALNDKKPEVNDTKSYDNGVKVVPAYLLQPVSVDKDNYKEALVDDGYYTENDLK